MRKVRLFGKALPAWLLLCLAVSSAPVQAQESATISGRITDPSGGVVPNVIVKAEETRTGLSRSAMSDANGLYTFANMPVGNYSISAEAPGFKRSVVADVRVEVAQAVRIDLSLELGAVADRVEVTASAAALQTSDSQVGGVVETKAISDLPLNGRHFTQLMVLMPGAVERSAGTVAGAYGARPAGTAFSVNGHRSTANQYLIDGFMAKEVQHGSSSMSPIIDALREFRVQSSNYTAEFGTEAGGQINAVLKSGTNEFHGTLWEFLRNDKLDANNFFNNRAGQPRAPFRRNQFGVAAGAPIMLPWYDGRNRTFIFGAYEGTRVRKGITQLTTVPTAQLRAGNFNGVATINDPLTGQPFSGNVIPAERINPIAQTILERWVPLPNSTDPTFNWISNDPQRIGVESFNWRLDHRISDSDTIFGHYLFEDTDFRYPRLFPTDGASQKLRGQNILAGWTHLFGTRTVNEFRAGFSRFIQNEFQARAGVENVVQTLGMTGLCEVPSCWGIPQMSVSGFAQFGEHGGQAVSGPRAWRNEVYQWQDSVYHTVGAHNIRFGVTVKRHRDNFPEAIYPRGVYSFNGFLTGHPFGDYLLGLPRQTQTSIDLFSPHFRNSAVEPWIQNDWRVTSDLTLNFGLRWEWAGRPVSKDNTISSIIFDPNGAARLITAKDPQGYPSSLAYDDWNNFAPRFGFAYNPSFARRTVIRGAWGIFYQREAMNTWVDLAINTPFISQTLITLDADPSSQFYFGRYNLAAPTALAPPQPLLVFSVDPNWREGQVHQWNFNIQQELGFSTVAQIGYVGNRAMRLPRVTIPNQPLPGAGPVNVRRPYQNFGTVWNFDSGGDSNYHGLQIQVEKRFSHGLQFINAYTWSKCIDNTAGTFVGEPGGTAIQDNYNFAGQRGLCSQDTRHRYSLSWVYDLPFGRGRAIGTDLPRVADAILGGWQINGILTLRTGDPFSVTVQGDPANVGDGTTRADLIGKANEVSDRSVDRWFNTAAFARPANFRFGTSGRNIVIGPGINNWDLSLFKMFRIDEARQFQFRGEAFNAFNRPQFGFPGATLGTAQFGRISSTVRDPRDIQLSLKFLF
ncbi:MAG TPA: carboxypeptidase regulatory-like domain-containing protein [Bryobacteraceae bacterium]|nr:carboxypeptidase regulatory-like domain-containing protein [Bryobacteraceae bacterium]